jgi:hypothetical protein
MKKAGIDHSAIESCMLQSGGTTSTGTNVLLDNEISALEQVRTAERVVPMATVIAFCKQARKSRRLADLLFSLPPLAAVWSVHFPCDYNQQ